uniref:Uncharacterized protein n=1 Tax=Triticum urartu TaxID=4572 RepID=A0A8R7PKW8_TRIUA
MRCFRRWMSPSSKVNVRRVSRFRSSKTDDASATEGKFGATFRRTLLASSSPPGSLTSERSKHGVVAGV